MVAVASEAGTFRFHRPRLSSPTENILAISIEPLAAEKLNEPHVMERLVGSAEPVTLSAGIAQKETLRLTDPEW